MDFLGGNFSASKACKFLIGHRQVPPAFKWLWKCLCQPKHKVFFWLLIKDRLSTRNIIQLDSYNSVLCQLSFEETTQHLFIDCQFSKDCWNLIGISFQTNSDIMDAINHIRDQSHPSFFMAIAILMCWSIWIVRNDFIFKGVQPNINMAKEVLKKELSILSFRTKASLSLTFDLWFQNLL
jgi:hypothetical protein